MAGTARRTLQTGRAPGLALALALAPGVAGAQEVLAGSVRDHFGRPLAGVEVRQIEGGRRAETDERGAFRLSVVDGSGARLEVRRIGFRPETVAVPAAGAPPLQLVLARVGTVLDPVFVHGRRDLQGPLAGFYRRMSQGNGRFLTQEQIERSTARRMSDMLRGIPGLRVDQKRTGANAYRLRGATVNPIIWVDGIPLGGGEIDLDAYDPRTFAGIEIYSGAATVPPEFTSGRSFSGAGGTIVLWTRQGQQGTRRRRPGEPSPAQVLAALLGRDEVWPVDSVDVAAALIGPAPFQPIYPDSLFNAGSGGQVEVEFVVDAAGRVRMETFGVVSSSHPSLAEAVRRAVEFRSFVPATRQGRPVPQLVQLPFAFVPDSSAMRKPKE
jgi:TonB family protein